MHAVETLRTQIKNSLFPNPPLTRFYPAEQLPEPTGQLRDFSIRQERRRALIARELARFKVDFAALSETRYSGEGSIKEVDAGYTFFYVGRPVAER
ncbi:unnamed protein product, partial [Dibothriocephalus latus]